MIKVLFICHGNICRSPMAEFIMKDIVEQNGLTELFEVASAATSREEIGNPIYPPAAAELKRHGIGSSAYTDFSLKRARQITKEDYATYDFILCAEQMNVRNAIRVLGSDMEQKIECMLDYAGGGDISDPWYTGDFNQAYNDIEKACVGFINFILSNAVEIDETCEGDM